MRKPYPVTGNTVIQRMLPLKPSQAPSYDGAVEAYTAILEGRGLNTPTTRNDPRPNNTQMNHSNHSQKSGKDRGGL